MPVAPPRTAVARRPSIDRRAVAKLIDALPAFGVDPRRACAEVGLDPAAPTDAAERVPLTVLHALWEVVTARAGRLDLPLLLAERYSPGDYALLGFAALTSPTMAEALRQVERFMALWTDEPALQLSPNGWVSVRYREALTDRPGVHRATEATLAEVLQAARCVTERPIAPREVRFAHPGPAGALPSFERFFRAPVRFSQPATEMSFDKADLVLPLRQTDPQLRLFLEGLATEALRGRAGLKTVREQLRPLLAEELPRGVPEIEAVARRLAMSGRTLRRRLAEEGTTFREEIDATRAELARRYVGDGRLALSEVAFVLGFSEPSAFHRAFKRWMGRTPGEWRRPLARRAEAPRYGT